MELLKAPTILLVFLATLFSATHGFGDDDDPVITGEKLRMAYTVPATGEMIKIDGKLDEAFWKNALIIGLNYEVRPGENVPPPVKTEVLITHNHTQVYFGFRCFDPDPKAIRAHLSDRDRIGPDDWVGVILDTFNDERRSFGFIVNPFGVQSDFIETSDGGGEWDSIWNSAAEINELGWFAEIAIPFTSLRFQRGDGAQTWGFDAVRSYPRDERHHIGTFPRDRNNNCYLCQAIKITGFEGVSPGRNLEIAPTVMLVKTDERSEVPDGDFETVSEETDPGITARWGVTPNLTLSGTLNPDFSQVEADARQLDINQPFALWYPEKRPFFMEGSDFFKSPMINAVYTRTIRDPNWGVKLSGKEGANTIGAFVVKDDLTNLIFPSNQGSDATSMSMQSYASVFRYKRDIGNRYEFGALVTDREGDDYYNRLLGFDSKFRLTNTDQMWVQLVTSNTKYPDEIADEFGQQRDNFSGHALDITYEHWSNTFYWIGAIEDYSSGFRADLGFAPRVDYRRYMGLFGYKFNGDSDNWYSQLRFEGMYQYRLDQDGNELQNRGDFFCMYQGPMQTFFMARIFKERQFYDGEYFDRWYYGTYTSIQPNGDIELELDTSFGDHIDYANTRLGNNRIRLNPQITYRLGTHIKLRMDHTYEKLDVESERLYTANVSQGTIGYQFSRKMMMRAILQYVDYRYNTDLYLDEDKDSVYKSLFTQFLFSYKLNPQTVLFVGYSDNYRGNQGYDITQTDRTFFAKVGYAWVM